MNNENKSNIIYYNYNRKNYYINKYIQLLKNLNRISVTFFIILKNNKIYAAH